MAKALPRKPIDTRFRGDEALFRRFRPRELVGGKFTLAAIELPDMSVNRGKYSKPIDALSVNGITLSEWGVLSFLVEEIPASITQPTRTFTFAVAHDPYPAADPNNYSHSEVRVFENGARITWENEDPNLDEQIVNAHYAWRNRLRHKLRIRVMPQSVGS